MNSIKTLENSIFWQNYILTNSRDKAQQERAKRAIIKLEAELNQTRGKE